MDINQLKCFISVAQTLNFSEAARRNYVSQSSVSRYVSDLEKEFGVRLFMRSHRDVIITNEGKALLPYAIEIVETLKKAKTIVKEMHDGGKGKVTIGCDVTSIAFPSKCISDFTKQYPNITVEVKQINDVDRNSAITGGEYDFCFMPRDMVPESSGIDTIVTHTETLTVITAKNSKFSGNKFLSLHDIAEEKLLLLSENASPILYMEIIDLLRTFHISPNIENTVDELISLYLGVSSGIGISIVPSSLSDFSSKDYTDAFQIRDADTSISYVMVWGKGISNPAAKLFMEAVKKYAKGDDSAYDL